MQAVMNPKFESYGEEMAQLANRMMTVDGLTLQETFALFQGTALALVQKRDESTNTEAFENLADLLFLKSIKS